MNIKLIAVTATLLAGATPSFAVPVNMNFEGASSFLSVDNFYNGGTDGGGSSGTNFHVGFGADILAVANDALGPYFADPALGTTVIAPVGSLASLFVTSGLSFGGSISFLYSATQAFSINAFDRNGANVGSLNLLATDNACSSGLLFCQWNQATLNLTGLARTVDLSGGVGVAGFDNFRATTVPAPAPVLLMASGLVMLSRVRLRRKRSL